MLGLVQGDFASQPKSNLEASMSHLRTPKQETCDDELGQDISAFALSSRLSCWSG